MPYYPDDIVNEVFSENDIVDYVSQYVNLKKSGRDYSGLCPFHREKSPSFHVSQDKQLFHCFGCGASGNLVQFVMRMESLDFIEALKVLADRANIILPENNAPTNSKLYEKKQLIYQMNKIAARFFYNTLTKSASSEIARQYFRSRKISSATIVSYGLGYAPDSYDALFTHLTQNGYKPADIVEGGLATERDGKYYDKFRNRVIFPIIDLRGNVIGFGGRIIQETVERSGFKPPKYLNSSETPVFSKGKNLFSLNLAKREKSNEMILAEGYMDVISVYQAGIKNIVATLGTALTDQQAKLLLKYCSEIVLCYDSDEAGQKAILRAIDIINNVGGKSRVVRMNGAKDPDEYIKTNGVEMFRQAVKNSLPSTEFKLMLIKNQHDTTTTDGKIKFINDAADSLATIKDTVEVDAYIKKLAEETGVSSDAIYSAYKKSHLKLSTKQAYQPIRQTPPVKKKSESSEKEIVYTDKLLKAERRLLNLITQYKKLYKLCSNQILPDEFSTSVHKQLANLIYSEWQNEKTPEPAKLLLNFSGEQLNDASSVFYNMEIYDDEERTVKDLINTIKKEKIQIQISQEKDPVKLKELLLHLTKLGEEL